MIFLLLIPKKKKQNLRPIPSSSSLLQPQKPTNINSISSEPNNPSQGPNLTKSKPKSPTFNQTDPEIHTLSSQKRLKLYWIILVSNRRDEFGGWMHGVHRRIDVRRIMGLMVGKEETLGVLFWEKCCGDMFFLPWFEVFWVRSVLFAQTVKPRSKFWFSSFSGFHVCF